MKKISLLLIPCVLMGALAVACGGGGTKTVSLPGGGKVSVGGGIPSSFPGDFPKYNGASVEGSASGSQGGITGTEVTWTTGDSVDKVTSFYNDAFKHGSWKSTANGTVNGSSYWAADSSDGKNTAYVSVSNSSGKTTILAVVGPKDQTSSSGQSTSTSGGSSDTPSSGSSDNTPSGSSSGATTSSSAPLPDAVTLSSDFPTDRVPFPSGARVTTDSSVSSGGQKTNIVELYVKDSAANVSDYFKNEMPKHNWTNAFSATQSGTYLLTFSGSSSGSSQEGLTISVQDSDTPGYAKVSLTVSVAG